MDWDDAYANMAHIPGSESLPEAWAIAAAAYRDGSRRVEQDIPYGAHPRERFDLIHPDGVPKGLAVFVHGGYWMRLDKSFWTHYAEGACAAGWAVAMPSYRLAPDVRIAQITAQIGRAIPAMAGHIAGPIRLAGHSAGGHLVARMLCEDSPLPSDIARRIDHTLSISGVHDLRPLIRTQMNQTLHLDLGECAIESPALRMPVPDVRLTCWVGGGERPEFVRQSELLANIWTGLGAETSCVVDGDHHHFSVLDGLLDRNSPLTKAFVG
ncbi:alpha/beta hydrolase [Gymnodinialimonas sp. 2305UL16-5]|uniref:alpha/beta hydrolase n=1 Tax=Gymnodinialimonas mytili TaxID=3126503 RepID=UPI0030B5ED8B